MSECPCNIETSHTTAVSFFSTKRFCSSVRSCQTVMMAAIVRRAGSPPGQRYTIKINQKYFYKNTHTFIPHSIHTTEIHYRGILPTANDQRQNWPNELSIWRCSARNPGHMSRLWDLRGIVECEKYAHRYVAVGRGNNCKLFGQLYAIEKGLCYDGFD